MEYKIREKLFGANKRSASGTSLTLNDTVKYPINKLTIDGVCEQKTTTGKNKLPYTNDINETINSTKIIGIKGTYTIQTTPTAAVYQTYVNLVENYTIKSGDYLHIMNDVASSSIVFNLRTTDNTILSPSLSSINRIFDLSNYVGKTIKDIRFFITTDYDGTKITLSPMIVNSSIATGWEQFTFGTSPNPNYPQNISVLTGDIKLTSCRKNLVNPTTATFTRNGVTFTKNDDGTYTLNGTSTQSFDNNIISIQNKINVDKNNFYKLSLKAFSGTCSGGNLSSNVNLIINNNSTWNWLSTNNVAKQPTDNGYIGFVNLYVIKNITFNDYRIGIQLEVVENSSSPSTDYEPYQGSSLNITIPENEFVGKLDDTYKDTLNVVYKDDGHYHLILNKMIGKVTLDDSDDEIWTVQLTKTSGKNRFRLDASKFNMKTVSKINEIGKIISTCFLPVSVERTWFNYNGIAVDTSKYIFIYSEETSNLSLTDFKSWLLTHNTEVCYALETPYEIDLGIVDTLLSYDEITNIFSDSDLYPVINVKYYNGSLDISNYEFSIKEV